MNEAPDKYRELAWREGTEFVNGFLDKLVEQDRLFHTWSPKLREFAERCRLARPLPDEGSLQLRERAKLPIYQGKIHAAEQLPGRKRNTVVICRLPLIAIPIAIRLCWAKTIGVSF